MKKITTLFLAIFATANIYSQTYTISFVATGVATTVDSVKVENITQGTTVKLHAGDVLQLQLTNSINNFYISKENIQVFPNPMQGQAEISFYAKQAGNATISIYDIAGKEVLQTENKLIQGFQKYKLTDLKQGAYFINISGINYFYSSKLISQNTNSNEVKIKFISNENPEILITNKYKSSKTTINMNYTIGNSLRFTGYSGTYSDIVNDVPNSSKTITFNFGGTCSDFTVTHTAGTVAPVSKTVTYGTVSTTLFGGTKCAITQNLGADHQATSANDTTEASAGWYWQFNRMQGFKHDGTNRTPNTTWIQNIVENSDWITTNDPCSILLGSGWRIPTITEWINADNNWNNYNDTYNSILKIHAAGELSHHTNGELLSRGFGGNYWSSNQNDNTYGHLFLFDNSFSNAFNMLIKVSAASVRCIND